LRIHELPLEEVVRVFEFEDRDASRRECVVYAAEAPDGVVGVREVRGGAQEDARDVKASGGVCKVNTPSVQLPTHKLK